MASNEQKTGSSVAMFDGAEEIEKERQKIKWSNTELNVCLRKTKSNIKENEAKLKSIEQMQRLCNGKVADIVPGIYQLLIKYNVKVVRVWHPRNHYELFILDFEKKKMTEYHLDGVNLLPFEWLSLFEKGYCIQLFVSTI